MKYLLLLTILGAATVHAQQEKVGVQIYYESLCPDSIKFFTKQLYPTLQHDNLAKYIELELIPYGKSTQEFANGWIFNCHHGPNECYANTVQACALTLTPHSTGQQGFNKETVGFINCLMTKVDPKANPFNYPIRECASPNNIQNVEGIEACSNGTQGQKALSDVGIITQNLKPQLKSVPTIVFNKHFDQVDQDIAVDNFQKALCTKLSNKPQIPECLASGAMSVLPAQLTIVCAVLVSLYKWHW